MVLDICESLIICVQSHAFSDDRTQWALYYIAVQ